MQTISNPSAFLNPVFICLFEIPNGGGVRGGGGGDERLIEINSKKTLFALSVSVFLQLLVDILSQLLLDIKPDCFANGPFNCEGRYCKREEGSILINVTIYRLVNVTETFSNENGLKLPFTMPTTNFLAWKIWR